MCRKACRFESCPEHHPSRRGAEAKDALRSALDELATRHGIPRKDVDYAVEGYADDMLSDAIYNVERGLERELEHEDPV